MTNKGNAILICIYNDEEKEVGCCLSALVPVVMSAAAAAAAHDAYICLMNTELCVWNKSVM